MSLKSLRSLIQFCAIVFILVMPFSVSAEYVGCVQEMSNPYNFGCSLPSTLSTSNCGTWQGFSETVVMNCSFYTNGYMNQVMGLTDLPLNNDYVYTNTVVSGSACVSAAASLPVIAYYVQSWGAALSVQFYRNSCQWKCSSVTMDCNTCAGTPSAPAITGVACSSPSPESSTVCAGKNYIGGCNGSSVYCATHDYHKDASAFAASPVVAGKSNFFYLNETGSDGQVYKCVEYSQTSNGVFSIAFDKTDAKNRASCISPAAFDAWKQSVCTTDISTQFHNITPKTYSGDKTLIANINGTWTNVGGNPSYDASSNTTTFQGGTTTLQGGETLSGVDGTKSTAGSTSIAGGDLVVAGNAVGKTSGLTGASGAAAIGGTSTYNSSSTSSVTNTTTVTTTTTTTNPDGSVTNTSTETSLVQAPVMTTPLWNNSGVSSRSAYSNSEVSVGNFDQLLTGFMTDLKGSALFGLTSSYVKSIPSGGNPDISFNGGRYGQHTFSFSTSTWASVFSVVKSIIMILCGWVAVKIVLLKGGGG